MVTVWAASPVRGRADFEPVTAYINLRELRANIQTDYSELDLKQYGNTVNEMVKLRFDADPGLSADDMIYLSKPTGQDVTLDGTQYTDYGKGDYEVVDAKGGFWQRGRNPFTVRAKAVVK